MKDDLQNYMGRPKRYENTDGTAEMVFGVMALGLLAIALITPGDLVGLWRPMLLFVGFTWLASGGATLYLYIRHTQLPAPEAE